KFLARRNGWDEERKLLFKDILAVNRAIVKNEIIRGVPKSRRVDPMCFIHDPDCKTDTLEDATYFGEVEYIPLAVAAERYGLSDEELKEVEGSYQNYLGHGFGNKAMSAASDDAYSFGAVGGRLKWFNHIDGQLKVLVIRAVWRDYTTLKHKKDKNEHYGTEHLQEITK